MATLAPQGPFRAFTNNGLPLNGGKLFTYEAGTSTPKATYTTAGGGTANANPTILNANGYADVWLGSGGYKFILKDSLDNTLWTIDDIVGSLQNTFSGTVVPTAANLSISTLNQNNFILCTATLTLSLLSAATAGQGFVMTVSNAGTGIVTIDPSGAELINGAATFLLNPGESALVVCDGTQWYTAFNYSDLNSLGTDVASAATTNLTVATSDFVTITGTTGITSFGTPTAFGRRHLWLVFADVVTITHNATSLIIPGAANYTTAAGDVLEVVNISGSNWRVVDIMKANGRAVVFNAEKALKVQTFLSSTTWTCPAGVTKIYFDGCGGGGGAGGGATTAPGGGGGGAQAVKGTELTVVPTTVYTVTIGAGGGGATGSANNGAPGGSTSLVTLITLAGGGGGQGNTAGAAGGASGGAGGGVGASGSATANAGGGGGGCLWGAGGPMQANGALAGVNGSGYGSGGGSSQNNTQKSGDGAGGMISIMYLE